jgi:hypothetical protein
MPVRPVVASLLAAALALATAPAAAAPRGAGAKPHPRIDVQADAECATCHRTETPQAVEDWEQGPHGAALVKCFVCHGSTGKDFRAVPVASAAACQGCHAKQVASLARRSVKDCFACHAPHTLSPDPHR